MIEWSIQGRSTQIEQDWISEIKTLQRSVGTALGTQVHSFYDQVTDFILVDSKKEGWKNWAKSFDREGKTIILVISEADELPEEDSLELVDDLLVYPFRLPELLSKVKSHFERKGQFEIQSELKTVVETVQNSNQILERMVESKTPRRFTGIKGMKIMSRHLSGLKPGGDYFDVFESEKRDLVNFLLSDSSSYGLSSALLGMILSSSAKMASDAEMNTSAWIRAIYEELKITLGEKEHLSLFFGRMNRRDFTLSYQLHGSIEAYVISVSGECLRLVKQGSHIDGNTEPTAHQEQVLALNPKDRLILLSDGFVNGVGGEHQLQQIFQEKKTQDPFALVNELAFQIKKKLTPGETFPGEDCSAIVIDIENRSLRLASVG